MPALTDRLGAAFTRLRARSPLVDHAASTVGHYGTVNGNAQAGAVTFFGFLSFFPILALGFFLVGALADVLPDGQATVTKAAETLLPGVVGNGQGEIPLSTFEQYAGTVGLLGALGLLYSGLGWLSGMRDALVAMFVLPKPERPGFVVGKLRDLSMLFLMGAILLISVALTGLVSGFSRDVLTWLGLDPDAFIPNGMLWLLAHGLAILASATLLYTMFRLLGRPHAPRRSLVSGALVGAVGFELLKSLASYLIALTKSSPSFQAFGVSLILLVWINYFSRLVMYSAAWSYTSPAAVRRRSREALRAPAAPFHDGDLEAPAAAPVPVAGDEDGPRRGRRRAELAAATGSVLALVGAAAVALRRRGRMGA